MNAFQQPIVWWSLTAVLIAVGVAVGWRLGQDKAKKTASKPAPSNSTASQVDERATLRASALDSLAEAVLVTDGDGRVRDCNSSALTLFNRHRGEVEEQYATALRRFDGLDQSEPYRLARNTPSDAGPGVAAGHGL